MGTTNIMHSAMRGHVRGCVTHSSMHVWVHLRVEWNKGFSRGLGDLTL